MSVLIKGMEMPVTCCSCKLIAYSASIKWEQAGKEEQGGWICLLTEELIDNTKREEHCPFIEVPTPYGRLIDADELRVDAKKSTRWIAAWCKGGCSGDESCEPCWLNWLQEEVKE